MHPLKLFPSCCRLCCALDAPLPASIVAFTGGKKLIVFGGKLECLEVIYIYICYNNYVKHIYLQYIHTYIQIYYNTSCTHTFPIIIHLILLDSFQEPMSLQPVDPPLESAEPGGGGEFLWLSYRWWFQNVSNILIFYPDP